MGIFLLVLDSDVAYQNKLRAWTRVHPECGFALLDMSEGVLGESKGVAIVLLGENSIPIPEWVLSSDLPYVFLEERGSNSDAYQKLALSIDGELPTIKKYQPVSRFFEELRLIAEAQGWQKPSVPDKAHCRLTVLLHPGGGCHLEPVIPILAALCAKKAATMLLALDPVMETGFWYPAGVGGGLSRLAYEVQGVKGLGKQALEACLTRDEATGVRVIRSADLPQDAVGFEADSVEIVQRMAGDLGVEMLLVDGGAGFTERNIQLADRADLLLLVLPADPYGARALENAVSMDQQLQLVGRGCWRQGQPVQWLFVGQRRPSTRCPLPEKHVMRLLPVAYPDGIQGDAWEVSDQFLRSIHALVPACGGVLT